MDTASVYDQLEDYLKQQMASGQSHEVIDPAVLEEFFTDTAVLKQKSALYTEQATVSHEQLSVINDQGTEGNVQPVVAEQPIIFCGRDVHTPSDSSDQ